MVEIKHTPAPWVVDDQDGNFVAVNGRGWDEIAVVVVKMEDEHVNSAEGEANARLIAAAPDMLEALENIENDDESMNVTAWKLIQDAIAKAKGHD